MYCRKCGSPINEGVNFCSACGEKVEAPLQPQQPVQSAQQPAQPPYGQQLTYGQPTYGQPTYGQHPKKKSKATLWAVIAAVGMLAIAALLIFVVFPGALQPASAAGPLSGNTPQTRFVNDSVRFFEYAFEGMKSDDNTFERIAKEPFDISYDMTIEAMGQELPFSLDAAYDNKSLGASFGFSMQGIEMNTTMLLLDNILYQSSDSAFGTYVTGIDFGEKAGLSKAMSLEDRVKALLQGSSLDAEDVPQIDFKKLAETFVNSIDEGCFKKTADRWTLTLKSEDAVDILKTFIEKLKEEKELLQDLEDYIEEASGTPVSIPDLLNSAVTMLENEALPEFVIVWEIEYEGTNPTAQSISFSDGETDVKVTFECERSASGAQIDFDVIVDGSSEANGTFEYEKQADGIEYELSLTAEGQTMKVKGSDETKGGTSKGQIRLNIPGQDSITIEYEGTIKFGAPAKNVADDKRFEVDTQNAEITDFTEAFGSGALSGSYSLPFDLQ